jgi:mannose-6-phosphate isomerase-like protein (cupin superfamily)
VDWVYADTDEVCQIVFEIPVGSWFGQEGEGFDVYERDIVWRVLEGTVVTANAETGEVHRLRAGESLLFAGDVWLQAWNYGAEPALAVEFTAPAKSRAADIVPKAWPETPRLADPALVGRWPEGRPDALARATVRALSEHDIRWRLEGDPPILVGHVASTPFLTVGEYHLRPGQRSDVRSHAGATTLYVLEGLLGVELPERSTWLEANPKDGIYLPPGTPYRLLNAGASPLVALFQVVPSDAD